jgi:hypothetical protein
MVEERIHRHRTSLDAEVTTRTTQLRQTFDKELTDCKTAFQAKLDNSKLKIRKTFDADVEAARLEAHELLAQETGRLRHEHKIKLQQLQDDLDTRDLQSVARTPKHDKPSPVSTCPKKLKRKTPRKTGILDLTTPSPHPSDDEMVTDTESVTDVLHSPIASKATDPLPGSRPTSTTPTQPAFVPKTNPSISVEQDAESTTIPTPPPAPVSAPPAAAPISEMALLLQAFTGFKAEVTSAISDLNSKVIQLQSGNVPSSQPEELASYYDDTYDESSNWRGAEDDPQPHHDIPDSHMTDAEKKDDLDDEAANKLYRRLIDTDVIRPGSFFPTTGSAPHDEFSLLFQKLCKSLSWSPRAYPNPTQLSHLVQCWSARLLELENEETLWAARNLFGQLSHPTRHYAKHDTEFQQHFRKYIAFCKWAEIPSHHDLPDTLYPAFRKFRPSPDLVEPEPKRVQFTSQPPISTLPLPASQESISSADTIDTSNIAFPPLGSTTPISFATVTRRNRKRTTTPSAIAANITPTAQPTPAPSIQPKPTRRPLPDDLSTSEYTVIIDPLTAPVFPEHIRRDPSSIVRSVQTNLLSKRAEIKVLSGQWSTQEIRKNFIFKLEGKPDLDTIAKYNDVLFRPFGPNCRAAPTEGYRQVLLGWVPVIRDTDNRPVSSSVLRNELMKSKVCAGHRIFSEPRWLGGPDRLAGKHHSSIVFSFYDPDGEGFELMKRSPPYLFGRETTVRAFESRPTLLQCARCLRLGHTSPNCKRSKSFIACAKCGGPHQTSIHKYHCNIRGAKHKGTHCDCPPTCFLCIEKKLSGKAHIATDDSCPLRKHFRTNLRNTINDALKPNTPPPTTPTTWSPTPPPTARIDEVMDDVTPSPAADGPFTLATEHTLSDGITKEMRTLTTSSSRLVQLAMEGKSIAEIGEIMFKEEQLLHAAGSVPNV